MTKKQSNIAILVLIGFFAVMLAVGVAVNIKNTRDLQAILRESVEHQLISTSLAARSLIDVEAFVAYEDNSVAQLPGYRMTLQSLRILKNNMGAEYIYALKYQGNDAVFVFDTDEENEEIFIPYELSEVHRLAFEGRSTADLSNYDDEYGSFHTGAVPLYHQGKVVGVVATDLNSDYLEKSMAASRRNALLLVGLLAVTMGALLVMVIRLLRRIRQMQGTLERQAHYDTVTGLPNRQYLLEYLAQATQREDKTPFALFFVDLDNFKAVNDHAGHDAGDELLRHIGEYLDGALENAKSFRPSAGQLNVAARVGGDEFIQLVHGVENGAQAAELAEKLLAGFREQTFDRYIDKYGVGLSIGVALYPYHSENYHVLIKYADQAMYHAKHGGKNQFRLYEDEMGQEES